MWRLLMSILALFVVASCGGGEEPSSAAVQSPRPLAATPTSLKANQAPICQTSVPPGATLVYDGLEYRLARVSVNWGAADCAISGHPIGTVPLPSEAIHIAAGTRPDLRFTNTPDGVSGFVWRPDFNQATPSETGIDVEIDERRQDTRVDLALTAARSQSLPIDLLPVGDYAVEISAAWPDGSTGYAFRVEIVAPESVP